MDALTPTDHIAIVAGIVVPAAAAIIAASVAIVRHVTSKSNALDRTIERLAAVEKELAHERAGAKSVHRELYDRLRHLDSTVAALSAKIDILIDRKPQV